MLSDRGYQRNKLRTSIGNNRTEWIESYRKVTTMIKEEKEKRWKEYVSELNQTADTRKIFRTVRAIEGKILPRQENEVLEVKGTHTPQTRTRRSNLPKHTGHSLN